MDEIIAYGKRVVVIPDKAETVTAGGLKIPEELADKPNRGKIISSAIADLKVGDYILYGKYCGAQVTLDSGTKVVILQDEDVLAILPTVK